jgi:predicted small secreted protein
MFKKIIFLVLISLSLSNCTTLSEMNEKVKGDGVPYIPGI